VEPFVKSRRAQTSDDDETWIPAQVTPTLNSFDVGDTRATTAIVEPMLAFDTQFGSNANVFEDTSPTLKSSQQSPSVAIPIQDGREIEKHQNGLGVGDDGDPSYTIDRTGSQSVAYPIQGNMIGRQDHNGPQGKGYGTENDPMFTLNLADRHAVALPMAVRRLTPLECERLMGWPDDHTRYKADGTEQADTHRYKQCGNGVASPVAQWIAEHMRRINEIQ
jgi:site-specific DNA-cytosine methylase